MRKVAIELRGIRKTSDGQKIMKNFNFLDVLSIQMLDMSHQSNLAQYPVCEPVFEYFPDCLVFLVGFYYKPTKICCRHVERLNKLAKHGLGPRTICVCIQASVKGTQPRLLASRINSLPIMCHTHLSFPISDSMDCNKVHKRLDHEEVVLN
ncbi:hypothetical protein SO802_010718 [Lithocarpus litseifolius]|uniref:Bifunctional inhibitor/plant lipid transfer protein/seed storage helical domain-containing protein n=1 Tax=Lithocarpus litseifolius TaxID=425828 RepID=A0AAW2DKJ6_9ROSI